MKIDMNSGSMKRYRQNKVNPMIIIILGFVIFIFLINSLPVNALDDDDLNDYTKLGKGIYHGSLSLNESCKKFFIDVDSYSFISISVSNLDNISSNLSILLIDISDHSQIHIFHIIEPLSYYNYKDYDVKKTDKYLLILNGTTDYLIRVKTFYGHENFPYWTLGIMQQIMVIVNDCPNLRFFSNSSKLMRMSGAISVHGAAFLCRCTF